MNICSNGYFVYNNDKTMMLWYIKNKRYYRYSSGRTFERVGTRHKMNADEFLIFVTFNK